jgi:hypothetical protein
MVQEDGHIVCTIEEFATWLQKQNIKRLITTIEHHHMELPDYARFNKKPDEMYWTKVVDRAHRSPPRNWSCAAQHFATFPSGLISITRSLEKEGGGIAYNGDTNITVEHLGNFNVDIMTEKQKQTIISLTALLMIKFPTIKENVYHSFFHRKTGIRDNDDGKNGHDEENYKSCPGFGFFGGNTIQTMNQYFIPLVNERIEDFNMAEKIKDYKNISSWAKQAVKTTYELGIFKGDANGNFNPKENCTREELAEVIYRILQLINK